MRQRKRSALAHKHIGTEHLLLGLLREEKMLCGADLGGTGCPVEPAGREELAGSRTRRPQGQKRPSRAR